ncbi:hypothetical protein D3C78_1529980 [compost metagenome]
MVFRIEILQAPEDDPHQAQKAHAHERGLPTPDGEDQWQQHGGKHSSDVGAGIEDAGSDCAFACREPQPSSLDAGRVVGRFGQAEDESADHEANG